jgi:hypothetical protein
LVDIDFEVGKASEETLVEPANAVVTIKILTVHDAMRVLPKRSQGRFDVTGILHSDVLVYELDPGCLSSLADRGHGILLPDVVSRDIYGSFHLYDQHGMQVVKL